MRDKLGRFTKESKERLGKKHTTASKMKMSEAKKGQFIGNKNPAWKGGKVTDGRYIRILRRSHPYSGNNGYIYEHRLVVEKHLGRYLKPEEAVHHENGIKDDNHPKNLMAFISESVHQRFHENPDSVRPEEIIFDGRRL